MPDWFTCRKEQRKRNTNCRIEDTQYAMVTYTYTTQRREEELRESWGPQAAQAYNRRTKVSDPVWTKAPKAQICKCAK